MALSDDITSIQATIDAAITATVTVNVAELQRVVTAATESDEASDLPTGAHLVEQRSNVNRETTIVDWTRGTNGHPITIVCDTGEHIPWHDVRFLVPRA